MCFHNLPINFDAGGRATLDAAGWVAPPRGVDAGPPEPGGPGQMSWRADPVTRVAGALEFFAVVDLDDRRVLDARTSASVFRGYELVMRDRDPVDAMEISSRACGVCGGVHSTTASMGLDMAVPIGPPPLGILARNLAQGAEFLYDHLLHLCLLAGPDYSAATVRSAYPSHWREAKRSSAPRRETHGFAGISDIMEALDPLQGKLYLEVFERARTAMRMVSRMVGRYPHPTTLVPGGITVVLEKEDFAAYERGLWELVDYIKKVVAVYEDLMDFFERVDPRMRDVGRTGADLLCFGRYDDPDLYDGAWERLDEWGDARLIPPAAIIDGEFRTDALSQINLGIEEFVEHSYYERWGSGDHEGDPSGDPLSPFHPWNKRTLPKPGEQDWKERYTWATAPRWDRVAVESGPIARHWAMAVAGRAWDSVLQPDGKGFAFTLPTRELPEATLEWRVPDVVNALERNRARALHLGVTWLACWLNVRQAVDRLARDRRVWNSYSIPDSGIGVGMWEAARGALGHWLTIDGGVVENYQIVTPSSFNASPRDPWGNPGPYERAAMNTPLLEETADPEEFRGIDLMRSVRSFDPCMPCTVHMETGARRWSEVVNSCPCGLDG